MNELRERTGSAAGELKSNVLLKQSNELELKWFLETPELIDSVSIHLTDKHFFIVGKIIDLIVEPILYSRGHKIYRNNKARELARMLFREAPSQLGEDWQVAADQFNTMLRAVVRNGSKATIEDFYATIEELRPRATGKLSHVLRIVHAGRSEAAKLVADAKVTSLDYLALDPTFAALATSVRTWYERTGLPVNVVHDQTSLLTSQRIETMKNGLADPAVAELGLEPVFLHSVRLVDSKLDARVQVADLLAGAGRAIASKALDGDTHPLTQELQPFLDPSGVWGDSSTWSKLTGTVSSL